MVGVCIGDFRKPIRRIVGGHLRLVDCELLTAQSVPEKQTAQQPGRVRVIERRRGLKQRCVENDGVGDIE